MSFFVISVLTLNIILWIVLLIRFKKLFSTDDILNQTQKKVEQMIREIDNVADRDTYLAKETTKRIQNITEDAERKMELFREATQRLRDMIAEADRINKGHKASVLKAVDPDAAYEVKEELLEHRQQSLFETKAENEKQTEKPATYSKQKATGYQEVPLIITKVYDDKPNSSATDNSSNRQERVRKLFNDGATVEEIAQKLNCSITEIQFIIEML